MTNPDEWLTITEVARRLGIHERQARRYANRLTEQDRTPTGQSPIRVRVSAISAIRERTQPKSVRLETGQDRTEEAQDRQDTVRPELTLTKEQLIVLYENRLTDKDAVIQAQREQIDLLKSQLSDAQQVRDEILKRLPDTPQTAPAGPETRETAEGDTQTPRPWWKRIFNI